MYNLSILKPSFLQYRRFALCAYLLAVIDCTLHSIALWALSLGVTILMSNPWFDLLRPALGQIALRRLR